MYTQEFDEIDVEEYVDLVETIKTFQLKGSTRAAANQLMNKTRGMRRQWIVQDKPNIKEVLETFPLLKDSKIVS